MKKNILITLLAALLLSSCGEYNKLLKSTDYEYKYEAAKNYFAKGQYNRAATLLNELIAILKGTDLSLIHISEPTRIDCHSQRY